MSMNLFPYGLLSSSCANSPAFLLVIFCTTICSSALLTVMEARLRSASQLPIAVTIAPAAGVPKRRTHGLRNELLTHSEQG